jgi:hypothetical protein
MGKCHAGIFKPDDDFEKKLGDILCEYLSGYYADCAAERINKMLAGRDDGALIDNPGEFCCNRWR